MTAPHPTDALYAELDQAQVDYEAAATYTDAAAERLRLAQAAVSAARFAAYGAAS